ncbi:hypothetical protein C8R43DRAFT_960693, partial [Mycena crocata]
MGKNPSLKTAPTTEEQLWSLRVPFPEGLDPHFRHPSDPFDDFMSAFRRASIFTATLGDNRAAYLWQQALKIGFRAGRADTVEGSGGPTSEDYVLGREAGLKEGRTGGLRDGKQDGRKSGKAQGLKEGETIGYEKGKAEGLSEGKRLGFVAGREFGDKQAQKLSNNSVPARVLVDVGTDSPADEISPPFPLIPIPTPTPTLLATVLPLTGPQPRFNWADEIPHLHGPESTDLHLALPPRDFSALRSDSTSTAFATLQHRARRTH